MMLLQKHRPRESFTPKNVRIRTHDLNSSHYSREPAQLSDGYAVKLLRQALRYRRYPVLLLPAPRGPMHGFYHFFFGYFVPSYQFKVENPGKNVVVVDSEPFNEWFEVLPGNEVSVISQAEALTISVKSRIKGFASGHRVHSIVNWDKGSDFPKRRLREISKRMKSDFGALTVSSEKNHSEILILGRNHSPDFYKKLPPNRHGAGKRNIPNIQELSALVSEHHSVEYLDPAEYKPIEIYSKISNANCIVGQHGAALCNAFFLKPGASVIEIGWEGLEEKQALGMYRVLCDELGLMWSRPILQSSQHSEVDIYKLADIVLRAMRKTPGEVT